MMLQRLKPKNSIYVGYAFFVFSFVGLAVPGAAHAATEGLRVAPLRQQIAVDPGTSKAGKIRLTNSGSGVLRVQVYAQNFKTINEQYDYEFNDSKNLAKTGADNWTQLPETDYSLAPNETTEVPYSLRVPITAAPGGHYLAIFSQTDSERSSNQGDIVESKRVASLVYITVAGDIKKTGRLLEVSAPFFVSRSRFVAQGRFVNQGNVHYSTDTKLELKSVFGARITEGRLKGLLMPGTIRAQTTELSAPTLPGLYRLSAHVTFPEGNTAANQQWVAYVPPLPTALLLIVTVVILVSATRLIVLPFSRFVVQRYKARSQNTDQQA